MDSVDSVLWSYCDSAFLPFSILYTFIHSVDSMDSLNLLSCFLLHSAIAKSILPSRVLPSCRFCPS